MKKIFNIIAAGILALITISCERDLTSLNKDPKHPDVLSSYNSLATGQYEFFYNAFTGSVNLNNFRFFVQQWAQTTYIDETNYDLITRNQPQNNYREMYNSALNNYETAKEDLAKEEGNSPAIKENKWATIEISQIAVWETLVDTYGNIPYYQGIQAVKDQFAPVYDDAKTIYSDLLDRIDVAISKIDESKMGYPQGDLVYNGNMTKWKRFANSIKLRLAMNLADVDPSTSKAAAEAAVADGVISSEDGSYSLVFDRNTFSNPVYDDLVASGRNDFVPTELVINTMKSSADPRLEVWFTKIDDDYVGGVFGNLNPFEKYSHMSDFFLASNAPANLLSYTETLFLQAEAAARGYSVGDNAESLYKKAITASMTENSISSDKIAAYIAANPYDATNWKKSIGSQAYIALFNRAFAAWNFTRRLDYPILKNPSNSRIDGVPTRMPYSNEEYLLNSNNVKAAATAIGGDKATTKLFWDIY